MALRTRQNGNLPNRSIEIFRHGFKELRVVPQHSGDCRRVVEVGIICNPNLSSYLRIDCDADVELRGPLVDLKGDPGKTFQIDFPRGWSMEVEKHLNEG